MSYMCLNFGFVSLIEFIRSELSFSVAHVNGARAMTLYPTVKTCRNAPLWRPVFLVVFGQGQAAVMGVEPGMDGC